MPHQYIAAAEVKYRERLTEICRKIFLVTSLPSHDHLHHARVWDNAASLLEKLYEAKLVTDPLMAEKAIIASFFHDTGLTINPGKDHGRESRDICEEYLRSEKMSASDTEEILEAVEKHDDKDYQAISDPASLTAIISVADDMDAFGCTGISRYAEIYSVRGIPAAEMSARVIENATSRFNHLSETYKIFPDLVTEQKKRAETLITYYKNFLP